MYRWFRINGKYVEYQMQFNYNGEDLSKWKGDEVKFFIDGKELLSDVIKRFDSRAIIENYDYRYWSKAEIKKSKSKLKKKEEK
jgi:hypothetical protein